MPDYFLTTEELKLFRTLNTPEKVQDFIDTLEYNWCKEGYVCKSPRRVLEERNAHCFEGALFAAAAQRVNKNPPLIVQLAGSFEDYHILAPFERKGLWGAMAQSKYPALMWRDPIYRSIRELALSYHPFDLQQGPSSAEWTLSLKLHTEPIDLAQFDHMRWMTTEGSLEELGDLLNEFPHVELYPEGTILKPVDPGIASMFRTLKQTK